MNLQQKAAIAVDAASQKWMAGTIWNNPKNGEVRIYLRRTNAARSEAGYIRIWEEAGKSYSKYIQTTTGRGSRTAEAEAEAVFAHYKTLRKAASEAQKEAQ